MNVAKILEKLSGYKGRPIRLMEICGTHTAEIARNGIPSMLSDRIRLVTGPGCPVCVTVTDYIDRLIALSMEEGNTIVSFGDLLRVPGTKGSLAQAKAMGGDVRYVYSPLDMIDMAENDRDRTFIFAAVGFETTAPAYALLMDRVVRQDIKNIKLLTSIKTMPQVIRAVAARGGIDGFLAPGHVAVITGSREYEELSEELGMPFVISGFKGEELIASIYALTVMADSGRAGCMNLYRQVVLEEGNEKAKELIDRYFEKKDAAWRGLGVLSDSGLYLREGYASFDAGSGSLIRDNITPGCRCADVITGAAEPAGCPFFGKACDPTHPIGACMVSREGACYAGYTS